MGILHLSMAILLTGLIGSLGLAAVGQNAAQEALKPFVVPSEPLTVIFEGSRPSVVVHSTGGRYPRDEYRWAVLATNEWVFVNGRVFEKTCPFLKNFAKANAPEKEMSPEQLDVLSFALKGKTVTVHARVPRFTAIPAGLEECAGYSYDAKAGFLRFGDKAVALLAGDQPDWMRRPGPAVTP